MLGQFRLSCGAVVRAGAPYTKATDVNAAVLGSNPILSFFLLSTLKKKKFTFPLNVPHTQV